MNETLVKRTMEYTFDISEDGDDVTYSVNVKNHDHDAGVYVMRHTINHTDDGDEVVHTCIAHFAMMWRATISYENLDGIMCLFVNVSNG